MFSQFKVYSSSICWSLQFIVAALYVLFSYTTNQYLISHGIISIVWLGSGVALSGLLLGGWRCLWAVLCGTLIFNTLVNDSIISIVGITLANLLEAIVGFWLLSEKVKVSQNILPNYLKLIALGGGVASIFGSAIGTFSLLLIDAITTNEYFTNMLRWWMGDTLGIILVTPFVLIWHKETFTGIYYKSLMEGLIIIALYILLGQIIFLDTFHDFFGNIPKGNLLFFCITVVAIRLGMRGVTLIMLITTVQALFGAYLKIGFFADDLVANELRNCWLYLLILSLVGVTMASYVDTTQQALAKLQLKDNALNAAANGIVITDINGHIQWANKAFAHLTGFELSEIQGLNPKALVKSGYQNDAFYENLWQTILSGKVWHGELVNRRKDGSLYDEEMTITPLKESQDGSVTHFVAVKQEITQRKYQEQLLKISEKNLREAKEDLENILSAATKIAIVATDKHGLIKTFNRGAELMFGYSAEEMIGKQTPAILHDSEEVQRRGRELSLSLGRTISGFQVFVESANLVGRETREWIHIRKDKSTLIVSLTVNVVKNSDNEIVGYLGISEDITQRKLAENALKESEERLTLSQEYGEIGSWEADLVTNKQIWSPALFEVIEQEPIENPTWQDFLNFVLPEDRHIVTDATKAHIERGEKYDVEYRAFKANGQIHWLRSAGRVKFSSDGTPIKFIGIAQDVTQRKHVELELQRSNAELEQFAYAVSHDMRQPLRMVTSYLALLEKTLGVELSEESQQFLTFALDGAKRMDSMIVSLLDYSRVGRSSKARTRFSTRECVDEAIAFLAPMLHEKAGKVDVSGDWVELDAIYDELTRLLQNLIGNALKYHQENQTPVIQVHASVENEIFKVQVQDNGIGIAPNQIKRLFKVFSRLQSRSRFEGTGVGLALCRKIVEHHNGTIGVESQGEGFGSTFWFEIPVITHSTSMEVL